jgi:hypothetical protein
LEYNAKQLSTFNQLINILQIAEKHDTIMLNNNSKFAETKRVPKANYGKMAKGGRNPNIKGNSNGRSSLYNHPNKKGNCNNIVQLSGNIAPRIRRQERRDMGHGGHANAGQGGHGNRVPRAAIHPPKVQGAKSANATSVDNELYFT